MVFQETPTLLSDYLHLDLQRTQLQWKTKYTTSLERDKTNTNLLHFIISSDFSGPNAKSVSGCRIHKNVNISKQTSTQKEQTDIFWKFAELIRCERAEGTEIGRLSFLSSFFPLPFLLQLCLVDAKLSLLKKRIPSHRESKPPTAISAQRKKTSRFVAREITSFGDTKTFFCSILNSSINS